MNPRKIRKIWQLIYDAFWFIQVEAIKSIIKNMTIYFMKPMVLSNFKLHFTTARSSTFSGFNLHLFTWVLKGSVIEKKHPSFLLMPNCHKLREDSKNVSFKIGSWGPQKLGPFSHFSSWEKRLSSGQKWFLRQYFPLIRGIFLLKSGLRFSFRALEVPEPRVRKRPY